MSPRRVTLVTGPPCAGKTTYAQTHAQLGDIIADRDHIAQELGAISLHNHLPVIASHAEHIMRTRLTDIAEMTTGTAWVIRSAPDPVERETLATWLQADQVLVLLPDAELLNSRIRKRPTPGRTLRAVRSWHRRYAPAACDTLTTHEPDPT